MWRRRRGEPRYLSKKSQESEVSKPRSSGWCRGAAADPWVWALRFAKRLFMGYSLSTRDRLLIRLGCQESEKPRLDNAQLPTSNMLAVYVLRATSRFGRTSKTQ